MTLTKVKGSVWDSEENTLWVNAEDYGVVGDNSTDDTTNLQAAIDSLGVTGGVVLIPADFRCVVSNLTLKENVTLMGMANVHDQDEGNDYTYRTYWGSTLVVSGTITMQDSSGLEKLALVSSGIGSYTVPTNDTEANTLVGNFSGTAITPSGTGCVFRDLMVLGFTAVTPTVPVGNRHTFERVNFDCTGGIYVGGGSDVTRVHSCHAWPYLTAELGLSASVNYRSADAFRIEGNSDRWSFIDCYSFGHERGFTINGSASNLALYTKLIGCSADSGDIGSSGTSYGFNLNGYVGMTEMVNCQSTNNDVGLRVNTVGANTGGGERLNCTTVLGCQFQLPDVNFVHVVGGYVHFQSTKFFSGSTSTIGINWDSEDGGHIADCYFEEMYASSGSVIDFATTAADNNVTRHNNYQASTIVDSALFVDNKRAGTHTVQDLTGPGAVDVTSEITHVISTGTDALTLADGYDGQQKFIVAQSVAAGTATLTPTTLRNGTTLTFDTTGDSAHLLFTNSGWYFMGGTATLA